MKSHPSSQQGFAAIAAVFLVVMLAALGAFMVGFSNTQQLTSAQDVQGSRAYWAARAGLEWGISGALAALSCPASPPATIEGFSITISCSVSPYVDAAIPPGVAPQIFQITSTAKSPGTVGGIGYTERSVSGSFEK